MKRKAIYAILLSCFVCAISFGGQKNLCTNSKCCRAIKVLNSVVTEEEVIAEEFLVSPIIPIIPRSII